MVILVVNRSRIARMRVLLLAVGFMLLAAGCGQKGPLYLRDNPPPGVKPPQPEPFKPLPYPKDSPAEDEGGDAKKN